VVPRLWRDWSPGYAADEDVRLVLDAIGTPDRWRAALAYYRSTIRGSEPPPRYAELHRHWLRPPVLPTLYLHGADDGCAGPGYLPWVQRILPAGSDAAIIDGAGHFLQLDRPEAVAEHILRFIGPA